MKDVDLTLIQRSVKCHEDIAAGVTVSRIATDAATTSPLQIMHRQSLARSTGRCFGRSIFLHHDRFRRTPCRAVCE
ncbi:hypothetical protein BZL30_5360 [Mycobacterium kansasii]|uniref:Uncharacterized protein n=1 Tax=Mycobacterium kansasii TaxID=1768 RepID=A0A1V3WAR1_MYCKA|nr:hypothetical protein BZL29_8352 [Mycobacterium kansasii]OOK72405.1 hypothetical protein BZL30_5360 [Mycobacterium kansasii]